MQSQPSFAQGILDSLSACIAVIDSSGTIIAANHTWRQFAADNGASHPHAYVGENYLAVCDSANGRDADGACAVADGVRSVLSGRTDCYLVEYPCHGNDRERWFSLRVTRFRHNGQVYAAAVHHDVSDRWHARRESDERAAQLSEARELFVRELDHRLKNLFALVSGAITLSARNARSPKALADALRGRIAALADAHALVGAGRSSNALDRVDLRHLVERVIGPHLADGETRLALSGPKVEIGPDATTRLALVLHELATNTAKYGAFSAQGGSVAVRWRREKAWVRLRWVERGGPVTDEPKTQGFGSVLTDATICRQMGGRLNRRWGRDGLEIAIDLPMGALAS